MRLLAVLKTAAMPRRWRSSISKEKASLGAALRYILVLSFQISPSLSISGCSGCLASVTQKPESSSSESTSKPVQPKIESPRLDEPETTAQQLPSMEPTTPKSKDADASSDSGSSEGSTESQDSNDPSAGESSPKRKRTADADSTLKTVEALRGKARQATNRKEYGGAFRLTSQAWEAARTNPKDSRLRQIADELAIELDTLGKQANDQVGRKAADTSTRLIDK